MYATLTVAQAASELDVSSATIYRLIRAGRLSASRVGRQLRLSRASVESMRTPPPTGSGDAALPNHVQSYVIRVVAEAPRLDATQRAELATFLRTWPQPATSGTNIDGSRGSGEPVAP